MKEMEQIKPSENYEKICRQTFWEFIHGLTHRYIEACFDGAYVYVVHPELRPPRPLHVKLGELSNAKNHRPLNYFVKLPEYMTKKKG